MVCGARASDGQRQRVSEAPLYYSQAAGSAEVADLSSVTNMAPCIPKPSASASASWCRAAYARAFSAKNSFMSASLNHGGHSAQVNMRLLINGRSLRVAQMGPDYLFLDAPVDHPPANASLVLQVDGNERQWSVNLPCGVSSASKRVVIAAVS